MTDTATSPFVWWGRHRLRYNIGLVVAGILVFIVYAAVGSTLAHADVEFEITVITTFFQGIGYLIMIGAANLCYFIGPLSELIIHPANPDRYRRTCFNLGFWFSVLLPFSIPTLMVLFH